MRWEGTGPWPQKQLLRELLTHLMASLCSVSLSLSRCLPNTQRPWNPPHCYVSQAFREGMVTTLDALPLTPCHLTCARRRRVTPKLKNHHPTPAPGVLTEFRDSAPASLGNPQKPCVASKVKTEVTLESRVYLS